MKTTVRHANGEYEVRVTDLATVLASLTDRDCVITDENVRSALGLDLDCLAVPPGETSKSIEVYAQALDWLSTRADRSSRVVALGGGVVGDLAGFAAATYMRGVSLLQVPTSLLAMVDSSVGGKVGIDLPTGKNLAGAFWPAERVLVPMDALATLPERHFVNGTAEVWKYAAIMDSDLFKTLNREGLRKESPTLAEVVMHCIDLKRRVVEEDERETTGRRAILNFGHTVGHAIEQAQDYQGMLHGEAIAVGMVIESRIAERLGVARTGLSDSLAQSLAAQGLPTELPPGVSTESLVRSMHRDKKADRNGLAFSFVSEIGVCKLHRGVDEDAVRRVLEGL